MKSKLGIEEDKYFHPILESVKTHEVCATIIPFNNKRKGFSDLTGAFPHNSSRGNLYVIVVYDFDISVILAEPITKQAISDNL